MCPIYEYSCKKCGYTKEEFMSITAKVTIYCGKCNEAMDKQISVTNVQFRGKGFPGNDMKDKT